MTEALLTRETLARIRTEARVKSVVAIAADLGWTPLRVIETAKRFGIEMTGSATESLPEDAPPKPAALQPAHPIRLGPTPGASLRKHEFDASMTLAEIADSLPQYQAAIVRHLIYIGADGDFTRTRVIAGRFGTTIASVNSAISKIKVKMANTRWTIEGVKQSGYRLVTQSGRAD